MFTIVVDTTSNQQLYTTSLK